MCAAGWRQQNNLAQKNLTVEDANFGPRGFKNFVTVSFQTFLLGHPHKVCKEILGLAKWLRMPRQTLPTYKGF